MLTPEYLSSIEFNDVVELYNKLNIEIVADIIKRVSKMQNITATTKKQLKILIQTNGAEIFNNAIEKTSMLTRDTKKALKDLFTDMAKENLQGYEELYKYREKSFKLSDSQYKILNQGLKQTNRSLKNFTNTIAFQSQQTYLEAIDEAYMQVVTGGFDYGKAINLAVQKLAKKGITLKDKAGRNVQLEVAVRRNIMSGLRETANNINRDIEEYLGCDGYEVTAHIGARPTHAEEQGKQFAVTKQDAEKFGVGLWQDVEHLWEEYNCGHNYFGIILGVSEPKYTNKELQDFKNATVTLNGKKIPYYEATQKQRALENNIRKMKRCVNTLEKAGLDTTIEKIKLRQLNTELNRFCKETGLEKDYSRIKTSSINNVEKNYKEERQTTSDKKYKLEKMQYYKDSNGITYKVDGKHVKIEPTQKEMEVAELLGRLYGGKVNIIPTVSEPSNVKTPDYIINNEKFDLKEIKGNGKNTLDNAIKKQEKQASNFIFDITASRMSEDEAIKQIFNIYNSLHRSWVDKIILIKDNKVLKLYKRK